MTQGAEGTGADVSVVVIAHNEEAGAARCIRSILGQRSMVPLEVVFVDDGSTDGTLASVVNLAGLDPRLRVVRLRENRGRGRARQEGVRVASGRAIAFVDADIILPADWLERCLAELPDHAAVGGIAVPDGDVAIVAQISDATPRAVSGSMPITGNNVLFDRAILEQTGFDPRDRLGEDFRLAARLQRLGYRLGRVPGLIVRHEESKTYRQALRWRFENGLDASSHPRELGLIRLADVVWLGCLVAWIVGIGAGVTVSPLLLAFGPAAIVIAGLAHIWTRFRHRPLMPFLIAVLADIPLITAYLLGRTVGISRLIRGRPQVTESGPT